MKRASSLGLLMVVATLLFFAPPGQRPAHSQTTGTTYSLTDLGVLYPASAFAHAAGINDAGKAAGDSKYSDGNERSFRVDPTGSPQEWFVDANGDGLNDLTRLLGLPSGSYHNSITSGINASGQVCGTVRYSYSNLPQNATVWSASGTPTNVGGGTGNTVTMGLAINDNGDLAGLLYSTRNYVNHAYLWSYANGKYTASDLGWPVGYGGAAARSVNNARQVVGSLYGGAAGASFLWLPSASYGLPKGMSVLSGISVDQINNSGIVAGTSPSSSHAALWLPAGLGATYGLSDGLNDLDPGSTWASSEAAALNNPSLGAPLQVIGVATDASGNQTGFVWDSGTKTMRNLSDPAVVTNLPPGTVIVPAWEVAGPGQNRGGINTSGQIAICTMPQGGTRQGTTRAVVLAPNP